MIKEIFLSNFGKFENYKIILKNGINIFYGENEAGKTTLINFISMIFYGNQSKSQDILLNIRKKYSPWNNAQMKGYIVLEKNGIEYKIERTFLKSNSTDIVNIYNNITGEEISISNPKEPGIFFFNLGHDAFQKTLIFSAENMIITNNDNKNEIIQKLTNMVSTGEEDISINTAIVNLDKKIEQIKSKSGHKGYLVDINKNIENLIFELDDAKNDENEKIKLNDKIENLEKEKLSVQNNIAEINKKIEKINEKNEIYIKKMEIEKEISTIKNSKNQIDLMNINSKIENSNLINSLSKFSFLDMSFLFAIISIFPFKNILFTIIFSIIFLLNQLKKIYDEKQNFQILNTEKSNILNNIKEENKNLNLLENEIKFIDKAIDEINYDISEFHILGDSDYEYLNNQREEFNKLEKEIISIKSSANERFRGKKNFSTLEYELKNLTEEKENLENEYILLNKTKDFINQSFKELGGSFSEKLSLYASKIISNITNSKYEKILIDDNFNIKIIDKDSKDIHDWKYASNGTIDQLYLSLRLAIIKLLIPDYSDRILFFDDVFMRFDLNRELNTIEFLLNKFNFSQILLFTNKAIEIGDNFNLIKL